VFDGLLALLGVKLAAGSVVVGELGQESSYSTEKARRLLGWTARPTRQSILDCARSILDQPASP
jgi:dihydroflavonol-4-reductase